MQQVQNSPAFRGAFKINYRLAPKSIRAEFESKLGHDGVQIFDKFEGKNNVVMYILRDSKDRLAADYIADNKQLGFMYYPHINDRSQFDSENQQSLSKYMKAEHPKGIKLVKEMYDFLRTRTEKLFSQRQHDVYLANSLLKKLGINLEGNSYLQEDGVFILEGKNNGILKMAPPNSIDFRYVSIQPDNTNDTIVRCLLDNQGELFKYFKDNEIDSFENGYNRAVRNYYPEISSKHNT